MKIFRAAYEVLMLEARLFHNFPKLRISVLGIILIPALYAFIYLKSVWDPGSHTSDLPAAIVNLDTGTLVNGAPLNLGQDLARTLREKRQFAFYEVSDAEAARRDVRDGKSLFALIVPTDFSASALGAASAGAGKVMVFASEGNNYAGSGFAKRFAETLGHQLNESLSEKRWAAVLGSMSSSTNSLERLHEGVARLRDGAATLDGGVDKAERGSQDLAKNVGQLADGLSAYAAGVSVQAAKSPADARLEQLAGGGRMLAGAAKELQAGMAQIKGGSAQLAAGLGTLEAALPARGPSLSGTPAGLANSVQAQLEIDAPVQNNGMGMAPNFIPVSLWLGAVMTAFIFHLRRLPQPAAGRPRASLLLGKLGLLWSINLLQAACVLLMALVMLGIAPVHLAGLAVTMLLSAFTFMLVILALVRTFGDAGKAVSLILLVLQLSAAGGVMPVELTNGFYRTISPWLPFTWSIKAVRASMFGALGGEWASALGVLALFAAAMFLFCLFVGRWKFVAPAEHRPAMDI